MARMFPRKIPDRVRKDERRKAECQVYEALKRLDDSFTVYYSRPWLGLNLDGGEKEGEADFVVAHPDLGFLVLEVKGGGIRCDAEEDQWYSTDRYGITRRIKDPVRQANSSKHAFLKKLKSRREVTDRYVGAFHAVVLPHCSRPNHDLGADMPLDLFAFKGDMSSLPQWVEQRMTPGGPGNPYGPLGPAGVRALDDLLAKSFELRSPLSVALNREERELIVLTANQVRMLDFIRGQTRCAITGGAGTGKTLLAVHKATQLAEDGERTLLTCFNRPLAENLKEALRETPGDITVATFHELCGQFGSRAGLSPDSSVGRPDLYDEQLPEILAEAAGLKPELKFDAIVVDEGQDFRQNWWTALALCLKDPDGSVFYAFYDDNQVLYGDTLAEILEMFGEPYALTENLRNTKTIFHSAEPFYSGETRRCLGPDGRPVEAAALRRKEEPVTRIRELLARLIREDTVTPGKIAVLGSSTAAAGSLREALAPHYEIDSADRVRSESLVVDTIRRFKGLERQVLILFDLEPLLDDTELSYVALTRAQLHLVLVGSEDNIATILRSANVQAGKSGGDLPAN